MSLPELFDETEQTPLDIGREGIDYVISADSVFATLHHRFYVAVRYSPSMNPLINESVRRKSIYARELWNAGRWSSWVFLHERGYRPGALQSLLYEEVMEPGDSDFADLVLDVWTDTENIPQCLDLWEEVWDGVCGAQCMSEEDATEFDKLPEELQLWRGVCDDGGWSWTLSESVARFFADRGLNGSTGEVVGRTVRKDQIMWYTNQRGEQEVFLFTPYGQEDPEAEPKNCAHQHRKQGELCSTCARIFR